MPTTTPRRFKKALTAISRGRLLRCCCVALLLHPSRPHSIYTNFFGTPLHLILSTQNFSSNSLAPDSYYTNFFLQPLCIWFYLHKRFLATSLHLTLTTQTFSSNSSSPDSRYTNFFLQLPCTWFLLHKRFLATPLHLILATQTLHLILGATPLHLIFTTQTSSSNSLAPDFYYTNFF